MKAINGNVFVTSRGIDQEAGGVFIPSHNLEDSNVCTTDDGKIIIKRIGSGISMGDSRYIVAGEDILAEIMDGDIFPSKGVVLVRKCIDREDDSIITLQTRETKFAEIIAVHPSSELKACLGSLGYVNDAVSIPEKVEETQDDWLIGEEAIEFVIGE